MRVLVIGLDSAPPELVFDEFIDELPNIKKMVENGIYGKLESIHPPITIPAWISMATSKSPGKLGLYGFRHRKNYSYKDIWIANSHSIKEKAIWDILAEHDKKSCLVGVPPSYPPKKINGWLISCFITPDTKKDYTYPKELKREIESLVGEYIVDVEFRTDEKDKLLKEIYEMTEKRFEVIKYLLQNKDWDFFMFVEIGLDRVQHAFWKFFDKEHHLYQKSEYENVIKDYYRYLDREIGDLLSIARDAIILIVSDHGAKRMKGAFCINEWLIEKGYLRLKNKPDRIISLDKAEIDWKNTKAWGWGGYYARIFLNVEGREPQGTIKPASYESFRDEIAREIMNIRDSQENPMDNKILKPDEIFDEYNGDYPDLMVYLDDLYWRSAGTIGHNSLYLKENDTGPDDAVHSAHGIFIIYDPRKKIGKEVDASILDIAPTILDLMGIPVPRDMEGSIIRV
ncbi:MAG: alkaline phosphatase family protein [Candidatus Hydrothermarchaeota archaeon]